MNTGLELAERYRQNADELRSIADALRDGAVKRELLASASDYERWANEAERTNKNKRAELHLLFDRPFPKGLCGKADVTKASQ